MLKTKEQRIRAEVKSFILTAIGTLILAFGVAVFILPFNLVVGGVAGVAIIIKGVISAEFITPTLIVAVLTWGLFFVGLFTLGRSFAVKTLASSLLYPIFLSLFSYLCSEEVLGGYFVLTSSVGGGAAIILAAVFGGVFIGVGCAITFLGGGSTGGMDILAFIICKLNPGYKSSKVILALDALVVFLGIFSTGNLAITLLGITTALVGSFLIDKVFLGGNGAFAANIITDKPEQMTKAIIERLDRTSTITEAKGGYSGEIKWVVFVTLGVREYSELIAIVSVIDPAAFVIVTRAHEISGLGWGRNVT